MLQASNSFLNASSSHSNETMYMKEHHKQSIETCSGYKKPAKYRIEAQTNIGWTSWTKAAEDFLCLSMLHVIIICALKTIRVEHIITYANLLLRTVQQQ